MCICEPGEHASRPDLGLEAPRGHFCGLGLGTLGLGLVLADVVRWTLTQQNV
jgi:hypothetical protein